uniref:Rnf-Nqr domain containing protein n=1 Tax=Gemmiger sp. TaxID=2049027 RepID=UPI003FF002D3
MQQNPNNRRRGEERNETLIIPHITKEMVETARRMAERGASRAEIEQAIAAMQAGKTPTEAESAAQKKPIVQPQAAAAPARNAAAHSDTVIIPTSRPRYTSAERRAMLEEVQRRQAEREAERQKLAQEEESHFRTYRDREYGTNPPPRAAKSLADKPQPDATKSRTIRTSKPAADATRTVQVPQSELRAAAQKAAPAPQPVQTTQQFIPESAQAPQIVPQTQPKPAVPAPEAAPKRRGPVGMPRTYAEAEAALNERIRADHIWLSNPVLVRGLGMAPVIGAALDGQRALMLCIAALILVTFTRVLAVAVCHLTKNRFRPVV